MRLLLAALLLTAAPAGAHPMLEKCLRQAPAVFVPAKGDWGTQGSTLVILQAATAEIVRPAIGAAWERLVREETAAQGKQGVHRKPQRQKRTRI